GADHRAPRRRGHIRANRREVRGGPLATGEERPCRPSGQLPRLGEEDFLRVPGGEDDSRGGALVPGDDAGVRRRSYGASQLLADLLDPSLPHAPDYPQGLGPPPIMGVNVIRLTVDPALLQRYAVQPN